MVPAQLAILGTLVLLVAPAPAAAVAAEVPPEASLVVSFEQIPPGLSVGDAYAGGIVTRVDEALRFAVVDAARTATARLSAWDPNIRAIEQDSRRPLLFDGPDDPLLVVQYGLREIRAHEAWRLADGAASTRLCIVDTGIRHSHADLSGPRYLGGIDLENADDDPWDDHGHGTHVAGIAAATAGNGLGIAGVAQSSLLVVKAMDENGSGRMSNVASGVRWCADQGAHVVSLSLGSSFPSTALHDAIQYAVARDVLVIAAAGNSGPCSDCVAYPAAFSEVVAVTCTDETSSQCDFSSAGAEAELAAPGAGIVSTWVNDDESYRSVSGTSMSAPHVAGVAALVRSFAPELSAEQVRALLRDTARDLGATGHDERYGHGLVDAQAALERVASGPLPPGEPAPDPAPEPEPQPEPMPANAPPVARAGEDFSSLDPDGDRVTLVQLDGTGATDADGTVVSYRWTLRGDVVADTPTALVAVRSGRNDVTLTVTDDDGATASDEVRVTVERNREPAALFTSRCDGLTCTFDATASHDPDGAVASFEWDLEDVTRRGPTIVHTFAEPDEVSVALTVRDEAGKRDRVRERLFVLEAPPVYTETFDAGATGWSLSPAATDGAAWRVTSDCAAAAAARGGGALAYARPAPACDIGAAEAEGHAVSPIIDVGGASAAALRFLHHREANETTASDAVMRVAVSDDGGASWRRVGQWRADDSGPAGWHEVTLDITRSVSSELRVRFEFDSRSDDGGMGWRVDDVQVLAR